MSRWIAVASAEYVQNGRLLGLMPVCHGKAAPLRREVLWIDAQEAVITPLLEHPDPTKIKKLGISISFWTSNNH